MDRTCPEDSETGGATAAVGPPLGLALLLGVAGAVATATALTGTIRKPDSQHNNYLYFSIKTHILLFLFGGYIINLQKNGVNLTVLKRIFKVSC